MRAAARELEHRIWVRIWLANLVGVIPINVYYQLVAKHFDPKVEVGVVYAVVVATVVYMPALFFSRIQARRMFRPMGDWIDAGREPSDAERVAAIDHPRRLALMCTACWGWAFCCVWVVLAVLYDGLELAAYIGVGVSAALSGVVACTLTYIVAEDAMRPLFRQILAQPTGRPRTVGVMPRLTAAWIVGSASYFIGIVMIVISMPDGADVRPFVLGACMVAVVVGAACILLGARSVAQPLDGLRHALARVERGDLDVTVDVDDAGEVGQLQAGFNRMVAGLRERDRLKQLFSRHVGPDVAERAVASSGLGGEVLDASVLFVDVIGSTTLAAERPPEAVVGMLNGLFSAVVRIVAAESGHVNQFQGDGALCIFGAPHPLPDHAARAVRAAVALRREIVALGDTYPGFDAAIGVSSGRVVGGDVGTEDRYEYTVIGDAANEASRLTDQAKERPGRILVSGQTIAASGIDRRDWVGCGEMSLRGRPVPTMVFEPA